MSTNKVSFLDIFGPVMIGPSSSHTAGVARIGKIAGLILQGPVRKAEIRFYGSLAYTYKGHGSDKAVLAGLLGCDADDERISESPVLAAREKVDYSIVPVYEFPEDWHPNTVVLDVASDSKRLVLRGASVGGGRILIQEINGYEVSLTGVFDALIVLHHDEIGVIAIVSHILAANRINIAGTMSLRKDKGQDALLLIEVDGVIGSQVIEQVENLPAVYETVYVPRLPV